MDGQGTLEVLDWWVIGAYLGLSFAIGLAFARRAGASVSEFFLSGRNLPWWLAGTSMVATTFAADTPLAITGEVARHGISGNWLWWNVAISGVLGVVVFARLWRRAGIMTDLELIELRYSGRPARALRGFRALYEGVFLNGITLGWVLLAIVKLAGVFFPVDKGTTLLVCGGVALLYTVLSGFWGVVVTDLLQFVISMGGAIYLAFRAVGAAGGIAAIKEALPPEKLAFLPSFDAGSLPVTAFVAFIGVNWWASKSADGGGYLAQRVLATRDERQAVLSSLWFQVAHYALRSWPWILAGLASLVLFPDLPDPELGYPKLVAELLPAGLRGLLVASFLAAFMSTVDTHLNWGASYVINDLYKRFYRPAASERELVLASRVAIVLLLGVAGLFAWSMDSVAGAWKLLFQLTAGIGGVYIMRWFHWRVNAWSEISAWISSALLTLILAWLAPDLPFGPRLLITGLGSSVCWLCVTWWTPATDDEVLVAFYRRVRPRAPGWRRIAELGAASDAPDGAENAGADSGARSDDEGSDLLEWVLGVVMIYALLFGTGKALLGEPGVGVAGLVLGVSLLVRFVRKTRA